MKVLIGSRALAYWNPNLKIKDDTDWDIISDKPIEGSEWHDPYFLNNAKLAFYYGSHHTVKFNDHNLNVMNLRGLSIIKRSHLWRELSFQKHITHYHKYIPEKYKCINLSVADNGFLQQRIEMTMKEFPQGNPKLNQSVEDFFDDAVTKKYNHDYLHELVAFHSRPLYTRLQIDSNSAWCEKDLWEQLTYDEKLQCVAEETYVIAIERFLVPNNWDYSYKRAYLKSLDKVCTTLCSGWFRDFAIDNYPSIFALFNSDRIDAVKAILEKE